MAGGRIKGLTVTIDGDTTGLSGLWCQAPRPRAFSESAGSSFRAQIAMWVSSSRFIGRLLSSVRQVHHYRRQSRL